MAGFNPIAGVISSIEIRTTVSAPITFSADELWDATTGPTDPTSRTRYLKPTLIIDSPLGQRTIAPYGVATPDEWASNQSWIIGLGLAGVVAVFGAGFIFGRVLR